ncbi:VOC family protein [Pseudomonas sp. MBLB4136]|uniref:VOC family protein n=1 Tax=Pseudomonas sp. MBLB4136 TaxID=3451558 RepID=UPI003F7500FD
MKINSYLSFDGQCEAAFRFYAECLDGKLDTLMRYGESPMAKDVPTQFHERIIHASLKLDEQVLMGSDSIPLQCPYEGIKGCSVCLQVDNVPQAERLYAALSAGGAVQMELQATFWAARFAMFTDRFGVPWMIDCEVDSQMG